MYLKRSPAGMVFLQSFLEFLEQFIFPNTNEQVRLKIQTAFRLEHQWLLLDE